MKIEVCGAAARPLPAGHDLPDPLPGPCGRRLTKAISGNFSLSSRSGPRTSSSNSATLVSRLLAAICAETFDFDLVVDDRHIRNFDHRAVDGLDDDPNALGGRVIVEADSDERHCALIA